MDFLLVQLPPPDIYPSSGTKDVKGIPSPKPVFTYVLEGHSLSKTIYLVFHISQKQGEIREKLKNSRNSCNPKMQSRSVFSNTQKYGVAPFFITQKGGAAPFLVIQK